MADVKGTIHKQSIFDDPKVCLSCGKMFYVSSRLNGVFVICPHCGRRH